MCFVLFAFFQLVQADDPISAWLRRMECNELLALHLESQLDLGSIEEQSLAAQALADLYASMLATADDEARSKILANAKSLLTRKPHLATTDLKLQLLRGTYLASEQVIEQYRFRLVDPESHAEAIAQLREVYDGFSDLRPALIKGHRSASGKINERKASSAGLCTALLAWSGYYLARHDKDPDGAMRSAVMFAELLGSSSASLQEISTDLSMHEYGARAILGIALCKEIANDPAGSDPWFEILEMPDVWSQVRKQIPLWRLHILIDAKKWGTILSLMEADDASGGMRDYWLLLIASRALEEASDITAQVVSATAIEKLVQLGQLNMVSRLVDRYGKKVLSETNFVGKYILSDLQFQKLRETWSEVFPSDDAEILSEFSIVSDFLQSAVGASDADEFPFAKSNCQFLLAHAQYQAANFKDAANTFYTLAVGHRMEEGLWMAIICLNYIKERSFEENELRDLAIEQYITAFPSSQRARQLIVHRSFDENQDNRSIEELLLIPYEDPMYNKARRRAEDLLYAAWREADSNNKVDAGNQYLEIARPLLFVDAASSDIEFSKTMKRSRRILDVALHNQVRRVLAAENVFKVIDGYDIEEQDVVNEITYRRLQLHLYRNQLEEAIAVGTKLRESFPESTWNEHAAVAIINAMRDASVEERTASRELYFELVLLYLDTRTDEELSSSSLFSVGVEAVKDGFVLLENRESKSLQTKILHLTRRLLGMYPKNRSLLRFGAIIEELAGEQQLALEHWKMISDGLQKGTDEWFEARYKFILLQLETNIEFANQLFNQHRALYPEYAPSPLDEKFIELESLISQRMMENDQQ